VLALFEREQLLLLDVSREKLTGLLRYVGSFLVFPLLAGLLVGLIGHSATLGVKTFLLVELGMAILSPLFGAVIASGARKPHHHRGK
jgi:predicted permease